MVVVDVRGKTKDEPYLFHHVHATAFGTALGAQRKTLTDQASGFSCTATSDFPASPSSYSYTDSTTACDSASRAAASGTRWLLPPVRMLRPPASIDERGDHFVPVTIRTLLPPSTTRRRTSSPSPLVLLLALYLR
jgi:hypothetical protein